MTEEEEELVCDGNGLDADFDQIIGFIEDIVIDPKFTEMQHDFMEKYYRYFDECEENKLEYMDIFKTYVSSVLSNPKFTEMQHDFMEKYYRYFDECEENKLEYMDIFKTYTDVIEKYIETSLIKNLPGFSMKDFLQNLVNKQSELDGEIFDILVSFTDFISFKEMLLDYKAVKEGITPDLSIETHGCCNGHK